MKKLSGMLAAALMFLWLLCPQVYGAGTEEQGVDVVIVVDTSGSMKQTDPQRISIEAAKLFVDMMENSGSRAGVVPFSDTLGNVLPLENMESVEDKESIKSQIDALRYDGDTDIGMALKEGTRLLDEASDVGNQKVILFFTDGNIDLGDKRIRTDNDSLQDVRDVVSTSKENGVPIYTIGLNANGNVDQNLLSDMAVQTGGRNYIVDSAENLPDIFNEIFADFINSNIVNLGEYETDGVNFTEIPLNIPNSSVMEANIIMLSTNPLTEVEMTKPDGTIVGVDNQALILSQSNEYSMLKMVMPEAGDWTLRIKSSSGCKVHINLIFNYKVSLTGSAELGTLEDGTTGILASVYFEKEGQVLSDESLYAQFTGTLKVVRPDGTEETYPMVQNGCTFEGEAPVTDTGSYQVILRVDSDTMYRESDVIEVSMSNNPPKLTKDLPDSIEVKGFFGTLASAKMDLKDYFTDPDGDDLTFEADAADGFVKVSTDKKGNMTIHHSKNGQDTIKIKAMDSSGQFVTGEISAVADCMIPGILPLILIPVLLIVLIMLLLKLKKSLKEKNAVWYGKIRWMVVKGKGFGRTREQIYDMGYEKGSVALSRIVTDPSVSDLNLGKVMISMNSKTNSSMMIKNHSKKCKMSSGFGGTETAAAELFSGDFVMLTGSGNDEDISVKITYSLTAR